ncbi:unnamed protein product [Closterium sp. NIES-54]
MSAEAGASRAAWRAQALLGIILGEKDSASFKEAETKGGRAAAGGAGIEWGAGDKSEVAEAEAEAEAAAEAAATAALRHAMAGATKDASTRVLNDSAGYNDTGKPGVTACGGDGGGGGGGAGNSSVSRWRAIAAAMLGKRAAEQPPPAIPAYDARAAMENTLKAEHDYARSLNTFEAAQGAAHADSHQPRGGGAWWSAWFGDNGRGSAEHGRHYGRMAQQSQAELHTKPDAAAAVAHQSVYATKPRELELSNPPSPFSVSPPSSGACSPPTSASSSSSSASSPESSASAQEGALPEPCYLHEDGRAGGSGAEGGGSSGGIGEGEAGGRSRPDAEAPVVGSFMGFAMRGAAGSAAGADGRSGGGGGSGSERGQAWGWLEGEEAEGQVQADVRAIENQQHALRHALERAQNRRGESAGGGTAQVGAEGTTGASAAEAVGPAGLPANLMTAWREACVESEEDRLGGAHVARRKDVDGNVFSYGYGYGYDRPVCSAAGTTPSDGRTSLRNPRSVAVKPGGAKNSLWLGVKSWAASRSTARRRAAAVPRAQREGEWAVWGIGFAVFALVNVQLITGCALLWLCLPEAWSATARAAVAGCASALVAAQLVGNVVVAAFARAAVLREFLRRKMKAAGKAQGVAVGGRRGAGRAEDGEAAEVAGRGEAVAACGVACALDVEQLLAEQGEGGNDSGDKQMMKGFHSRPLLVYKAEQSTQPCSETASTAPTNSDPYSAPSPAVTAAAAASASAAASAAAAAAAAAPPSIRNGSSGTAANGIREEGEEAGGSNRSGGSGGGGEVAEEAEEGGRVMAVDFVVTDVVSRVSVVVRAQHAAESSALEMVRLPSARRRARGEPSRPLTAVREGDVVTAIGSAERDPYTGTLQVVPLVYPRNISTFALLFGCLPFYFPVVVGRKLIVASL